MSIFKDSCISVYVRWKKE